MELSVSHALERFPVFHFDAGCISESSSLHHHSLAVGLHLRCLQYLSGECPVVWQCCSCLRILPFVNPSQGPLKLRRIMCSLKVEMKWGQCRFSQGFVQCSNCVFMSDPMGRQAQLGSFPVESNALASERMGHLEPSWATSLSLPRRA